MKTSDELFLLAAKLEDEAAKGEEVGVQDVTKALEGAASKIERSFSGSWLGYHSTVYYANLEPAPPGANFSQEWGLSDTYGTRLGSRGDWRQFDREVVRAHALNLAGNPNLNALESVSERASEVFCSAKDEIGTILEAELTVGEDSFIMRLRDQLAEIKPVNEKAAARGLAPGGAIMTRDTLALGQGTQIPPHYEFYATVIAVRSSFNACREAAKLATKAASYLERKHRSVAAAKRIGTNVFIGHGRSAAWRELKDFVADRLKLPWDEFNRVPVAGVTNIARLAEMLDAAAVALLVLTAEDELADGEFQARMNVVHEAGLFQGRLGFSRAIVLLEDGCAEFSNIQGLGQIRFPKGKVSASFEEVRRVLERESIVEVRH